MDDFNFYMRLAKPLVLNLPNAKDRTTAARWLKKLSQIDQPDAGNSDNLRVEYLKLLLFVMQSNRLSGIFEEPPPDGDLQEISHLSTEQKKAKDMIELTKGRNTGVSALSKIHHNKNQRVRRSISGDMCEYVAIQEIPDFGIHGYYALSAEPLPIWWNPQTIASSSEGKVSSPPVIKGAREDSAFEAAYNSGDSVESFHDAIGEIKPKTDDERRRRRSERLTKLYELSNREMFGCKKMRHGEKSLKKIYETRRSSIAGVESRPCWGRIRYIDRLVDESPHLVGDLDLSEADALLHLYREKRLRRVSNETGKEVTKAEIACSLSSRRKQVEARLDMPPCASIVVEEEDLRGQRDARCKPEHDRTCLPRKNDLERSMNERPFEGRDCCSQSDDEDGYRTYSEPGSAASISLRGGGSNEFATSRSKLSREFQYR